MTRCEVFKILAAFLDDYLKFSGQPLLLVLDEKILRIKTPTDLTSRDVIVRKFSLSDLKFGLSSKEWSALVEEVFIIVERYPQCLG